MSFCLVGRGAILLATLFVAGATESLPWLCDERGGCWPQTWIIGGMKCGSTSFFYWLHHNRGVCAAAVVEHVSSNSKETNFWTRNSTRNSDGAAFPTLYPAARRGECAGGFVEATPTNMRVPATPGALAAALPAAFRGALPDLRFEPVALSRHAATHTDARNWKTRLVQHLDVVPD